MRHLRPLACATTIAAAVVAAPAATAAPKRIVPVTAQEIAYNQGFDVMVWDSVNGLRKLTDGYDPSLSSDGRYLVYARKTASQCRKIVMWDLWRKKTMALPGVLRATSDDCADSPALSKDGKLLVWSGEGNTSGNPSDLYLYDVVAKRRIPLPASINSASNEQSPSISDDGRRLAFVSGRNGITKSDDVLVADISQVRTTGAASLVAGPAGLQADGSQGAAQMSGDGSTFVWTNERDLNNDTFVFDGRGAGSLLPAPALRSGLDTYGPAVNRDGSVVVVGRQLRDLGDRGVWVWRRATGAITEPRALRSTLGDDAPTVSWPARVADLTPPRLKLTCRGAFRRVTCTLRTNEAGKGTVRTTLGGRRLKAKKVSFRRAGKKTLVFRTHRSGTVGASARLADRAGNVGRAKRSARAR
jgi:dipeptidyl aminopeptidase/acylaminoacyl peptidase